MVCSRFQARPSTEAERCRTLIDSQLSFHSQECGSALRLVAEGDGDNQIQPILVYNIQRFGYSQVLIIDMVRHFADCNFR